MFKLLDYTVIGERIKKYRLLNNLTQSDLSDKIGVTDKYISLIERGHTKISLPRLAKISNALKVDITVLLKNVDDYSEDYLSSDIIARLSKMSPKTKKLVHKIITDIIELEQ